MDAFLMPSLAAVTQRHDVVQEVFEISIVNFLLGESRHRAQPLPDLEPHQKTRQGLVINDGTHSAFAASMALVAMRIVQLLAALHGGIIDLHRAGEGFAAPC